MMSGTSHVVLLALGLGSLVMVVTALARRLPIPTPIVQVGAGFLVGLIPGAAVPELDPDLVFFVFLPPVLWSAAYFTSLREFKANLRPIGLLAIGLVVATTGVVAVASHALLPGLPWAVALALGAIVSPPDAIAAEAIIKRLPVPHRVVVILEGESLVNDASALILYRTAIVAAVTGYFSLGESVVRFFIDAAIGILIGLAVAWFIVAIARRATDSIALALLTLLAPYSAWIAAELVHVSAVLSCVAGGFYLRQHFSTAVAPLARLQNRAVWDVLLFTMNALIFVLLGIQFGDLLESTPNAVLARTGLVALAVSGIVIVVRLVWVPLATFIPRWASADLRRRDPVPNPKSVGLVAWTSMRGIVSLASALAVPLFLADGRPFPYRLEILIITMGVILVTLVLQGITLAPLIRKLGFPADPTAHIEERHARSEALRSGLERLEDLADEPWVSQDEVGRLREEFRRRSELHQAGGGGGNPADARRRLRREVLRAERRAMVRLRDEGAISDEVLQELERELDVEALRLGGGELR
ncbi:MAG: Na+/H+ antiporter [Gemmatimonadota bacterium]